MRLRGVGLAQTVDRVVEVEQFGADVAANEARTRQSFLTDKFEHRVPRAPGDIGQAELPGVARNKLLEQFFAAFVAKQGAVNIAGQQERLGNKAGGRRCFHVRILFLN